MRGWIVAFVLVFAMTVAVGGGVALLPVTFANWSVPLWFVGLGLLIWTSRWTYRLLY